MLFATWFAHRATAEPLGLPVVNCLWSYDTGEAPRHSTILVPHRVNQPTGVPPPLTKPRHCPSVYPRNALPLSYLIAGDNCFPKDLNSCRPYSCRPYETSTRGVTLTPWQPGVILGYARNNFGNRGLPWGHRLPRREHPCYAGLRE